MTITYEITDQVLTDCYTVVVRGEMPTGEFAGWLREGYQSVFEYLAGAGIVPAGPPFARYTFLDGAVAVEAGVPVPHEVAGQGRVEPSTLPDGHAAVTVHTGRYEDLDKAYEALNRWLKDHDHSPAGPHWEIYFTDPNTEPDPARWRTEVVMPYR
jgi:effector-binding domain-containing protein